MPPISCNPHTGHIRKLVVRINKGDGEREKFKRI